MKAYEGRYDEKYTWLKSMGGFFDDILRFADYIPVVLSHTIHLSFYAIIFTIQR